MIVYHSQSIKELRENLLLFFLEEMSYPTASRRGINPLLFVENAVSYGKLNFFSYRDQNLTFSDIVKTRPFR